MCFSGPYVTSVSHTARISDMESHCFNCFHSNCEESPNLKNAHPLPSYTWDPERRKADISHPIGQLVYSIQNCKETPLIRGTNVSDGMLK